MSKPVILCNTLHITEDEWLKKRMDGIGGSDAAAAVGENPYCSPVKLWLEKTGQVEPDDLSDNERVQIGKEIEDFIAGLFVKRTGLKVRRRNAIFQHSEHSFLFANVDREIVGKNEGLEIKNVGFMQAKNWEGDDIPNAYFIQIQHYCAVMGWDGCHVTALIGGQRFLNKYITRDDQFIEWMIRQEKTFWQHVLDGTMPVIDGSESCSEQILKMHPEANGQTIDLPHKAHQWLLVRKEAVADLDEAEQRKEEADNNLKELLGDNSIGLLNGEKAIEWVNVKGRESIDSKALKAKYPKIAAEFIKTGNPTRKFSVKI